ncbi:MAG: AgmX/PglI C-terminal domain-containing protein [Kofleriaceae bacterium]
MALLTTALGCGRKSSTEGAGSAAPTKDVHAVGGLPTGPLPVSLPTVRAEHARIPPAVAAFVTIAKDGSLRGGRLSPGPEPYAGDALEVQTLDASLFGAAPVPAPPPAEDRAPAPAAATTTQPSSVTAHERARKLAINAARLATLVPLRAAVIGALDDEGSLDAVVLADRDATASVALDVLIALARRRTSLAVASAGSLQLVRYHFSEGGDAPTPAATVYLDAGHFRVSFHDAGELAGPSEEELSLDQVAHALRPVARGAAVQLTLTGAAPTQQLVELLGVLASAGAISVAVMPALGGGGLGGSMRMLGADHAGFGFGIRSTDGPSLEVGAPTITGPLDAARLLRFVRRAQAKLTYCYEKELAHKPTLAGEIAVTFEISTLGQVRDASASGVDDVVATCVAKTFQQLRFIKLEAKVGVSLSLQARPRGTAAEPSLAPGASGSLRE